MARQELAESSLLNLEPPTAHDPTEQPKSADQHGEGRRLRHNAAGQSKRKVEPTGEQSDHTGRRNFVDCIRPGVRLEQISACVECQVEWRV